MRNFMDKRTKILVSCFGVGLAYAVFSTLIYPTYVVPLLTLKERIATEQATLDKLEEQDSRFEQGKREYRRFAERVGAMDVGKVENSIRARLDELIVKHKLADASVSPSRGTADKTGIERMTVSISGVGGLESVIRFMQDVSELPHLIRIGNVSIYPASSGKRNEKADRVNMRLPIEVVVLPQQKALGQKLEDKDFKQPEKIVRHQGRDYSAIWKKTPFMDHVPLPPLVANAGQPQTVPVGQSVMLNGSATGGDGKYTFEWTCDGLAAQQAQSVAVDTSAIGQKNCNLVVKDGSDNAASAKVTITIIEPPPPPPVEEKVVEVPPPPPPPPVKTRNTWTDRAMRQVAMTLQTQGVPGKEGELLVVNQGTRERTYHAVGEEFDGGKLVYVDTRGGIVKWEDKFYIYPLGAKLDQDIPADSATNHPDLLRIVERLKLADAAPGPKVAPEEGAAPPEQPVNPDGGQPVPEGGIAPNPIPEQVGATPGTPSSSPVAAEVIPNAATEGAPTPAPQNGPAATEVAAQPTDQQPNAVPPPSPTLPPAAEGQAIAPVPTDGVVPASVPVDANKVVAPTTAGEGTITPPVKDVLKERPARAKSRRPVRPKPVAVPPPAQEEKQNDAPAEEKKD